jgi:hypothetical protein
MAMSRTNTLVGDYEYVSELDAAVARPTPPAEGADAEAVKAFEAARAEFGRRWRQYLDGMAEPPLLPGSKPIRIKLRHLSDAEREYVHEVLRSGDDESRVRAACFAATMIALVGAEGDGPDGPIEVAFETTKWGLIRIRYATEASVQALARAMTRPGLQGELGGLIFERMRVRPS